MTPVKLQCTDDGAQTPTIKEFDLPYAQRILDVKLPNNGWILKDEDYILVKGVITAISNGTE